MLHCHEDMSFLLATGHALISRPRMTAARPDSQVPRKSLHELAMPCSRYCVYGKRAEHVHASPQAVQERCGAFRRTLAGCHRDVQTLKATVSSLFQALSSSWHALTTLERAARVLHSRAAVCLPPIPLVSSLVDQQAPSKPGSCLSNCEPGM
jgi:hypothetical protein